MSEFSLRWSFRTDVEAIQELGGFSADAIGASKVTPQNLSSFLNRPHIGVTVAEHRDKVCGYVLYELLTNRIYLRDVRVAQPHRRKGLGTKMVGYLKDKLVGNRKRIEAFVSDQHTDAHLFLRAQGFLGSIVKRKSHRDIEMYQFRFDRPV